MGDNSNFGELTASDIDKLRSVVNRKSSEFLSHEDRQDIVSKILEDATRASLRSGTPIVALAFTYAEYSNYYARPLAAIGADLEHRQTFAYNDDGELLDRSDVADERIDFTMHDAVDFIARLPRDEARAFAAAFFDLTIAEASALLNIAPSTIHARTTRARAALQVQLSAA